MGTVKSSSRGFPKELVFPSKPKPQWGASDWGTVTTSLQCLGLTINQFTFLAWLTNLNVLQMSSKQIKLWKEEVRKGVGNVPSPPLLKDHNKYMCEIDCADQNSRYYNFGRQCKRWPTRSVFHQLETSINNAYQLYQVSFQGPKPAREFHMQPTTELVHSFSTSQAWPVGQKRANPDANQGWKMLVSISLLWELILSAVYAPKLLQQNTCTSAEMSQQRTPKAR